MVRSSIRENRLPHIWLWPTGIVDEGTGPNNEPVAIKKELASKKVTRSMLEHEYHVYKALAGQESIPNVRAYGYLQDFNHLVMDLLGPSLADQGSAAIINLV
jgi:hypothetical protein